SLSGLQRMQIFALIAAIEAGYHVRPDGLEMRARQMSLLRRLILEGLDDRVAMLPVQPVEPEVEGVRLVLPDSLLHLAAEVAEQRLLLGKYLHARNERDGHSRTPYFSPLM